MKTAVNSTVRLSFASGENTMNQPYLSPDDLPSHLTKQISEIWLRQLEEAIKQSFYQASIRMTRILLSSCHWYFKINTGILTLIMICPDIEVYQNIMKNVPQLANNLTRFANRAIISVTPPIDKGIPLFISIDEALSDE